MMYNRRMQAIDDERFFRIEAVEVPDRILMLDS